VGGVWEQYTTKQYSSSASDEAGVTSKDSPSAFV
jgi:hypothetical protein